MSKKDYEVIAYVFNEQVQAAKGDVAKLRVINELAEAMARQLIRQNPAFQPMKFLNACGF